LNAGGYRFSRLDRNDWLPFSVDELRPRDWLKGTDAVLLRDDRRVAIATDFPEKPQLVCFSSGELTPFRLELGLADLAQRLRLDGKPDGSVELAAVDTHAQ
jgi:general secretion pathway protein H